MAAANDTYSGVIGAEILDSIEIALGEAIADSSASPRLQEAIEYAVMGPGKRLRPALTIHACTAAGGEASDALPAAVALELIHAFSLVHDDLPAMDDDSMRRGRPTLHTAMGEAIAILAGDAIQALAARTAARSPRAASAIVQEVLAATRAMIDGQVMDTLGELPGSAQGIDRVRMIHERKTGALFKAACRCGAMVAPADEETTARLERYGAAIGLMFQAVDDLLDETQSSDHLGKTAGKDHASGKHTYPAEIGIDATREVIQALKAEALEAIGPLGASAAPLEGLAELLANRTK